MDKHVPHKNRFDGFSTLKTSSAITLLISTGLSLAIRFLDPNGLLKDKYIIIINALLVIIYIILEIIANYIFSQTQIAKRLDNVDNAFGSNYTGGKSQNYFSNDELSHGIYKLGVNCFENCFFTANITKKMQVKSIIIIALVAISFLTTSFLGYAKSSLLLVQLILPFAWIQDFIKLRIFINRNQRILDNFKEMFNDIKETNSDTSDAKIIRNILDYETNVSWSTINVSSRIYNKVNEDLSKDWEKLKQDYNIHH